jgi:hypothetical protein
LAKSRSRADKVYYVTDVYTWADALSPGRLFLSIKTGLRDVNYPGTVIGQFYYSLEALIALYLTVTKARAERLLGQELARWCSAAPSTSPPTPQPTGWPRRGCCTPPSTPATRRSTCNMSRWPRPMATRSSYRPAGERPRL